MPTPDDIKLSALPLAATLVDGDFVPVLRTSALLPKDQNVRVAASAFALPPNAAKGVPKSVIYLTHAEAVAAGHPYVATLDQLDPATLCLGTLVRVDLHPDAYGQHLELLFDDAPRNAPGLRVFTDGNFQRYYDLVPLDGLQPARWVKVSSAAAASAGVRRYTPAIADWKADELMKIALSGADDSFFSTISPGGPFAAPLTPGAGTADWRPAAAPAAPATPSQAYPLSYAQYVASAHPDAVVSGRAYEITGPWNGGAPDQVVSVPGTATGFGVPGTLLSAGTRTAVLVDVAAGTAVGLPATSQATIAGNPRIFATYELAEAAAATGAVISLTGYHAAISIDKSVTVTGGTVGDCVIGYVSAGIDVRVTGLVALGRFVVCPRADTALVVDFSDLTTGPAFYLESYAFLASAVGSVAAQITVAGVRARNTAAYAAPANATAGAGLLRFQERNAGSQWTFQNCDELTSANGPVATGYPFSTSRIVLAGLTVLTPGGGHPAQETAAINQPPNADAAVLVDARTYVPVAQNQYGAGKPASALPTLNSFVAYMLGAAPAPPAPVAPTITGFSPTSGPVGTVITLTGTGFGPSAGTTGTVKLNGLLTYPTAWADTAITFPVPTGGTSGPLTVATANGTAISNTPFTVTVTTGTPSQPQVFTPQSSEFRYNKRNDTTSAGSGYVYRDALACWGRVTDATALTIKGKTTYGNQYIAGAKLTVYVDGSWFNSYVLTQAGTEQLFNVTGLPAGSKLVEIYEAAPYRAGEQGNVLVVNLTEVTFPAGATVTTPVYPQKQECIVTLGNSRTVGGGVSDAPRHAFTRVLGRSRDADLYLLGYSSLQLGVHIATSAGQQNIVNECVARAGGYGSVRIMLGPDSENDWGYGTYTVAQIQTAYQQLIPRLQAALPQAKIYVGSTFQQQTGWGNAQQAYHDMEVAVAAGFTNVYTFDTMLAGVVSGDYFDAAHLNELGDAKLAYRANQVFNASDNLPTLNRTQAMSLDANAGAQTILTLAMNGPAISDPEYAVRELLGGAWQSSPSFLLYNAATPSNAAGYYTLQVRSVSDHTKISHLAVAVAETIDPNDGRNTYTAVQGGWNTIQFAASPFSAKYGGNTFSDTRVSFTYAGFFELWNREQPNVAAIAFTRSSNGVRQVAAVPPGPGDYSRCIGNIYAENWKPAQATDTFVQDGDAPGSADFYFGYRLQYPAGTVSNIF